MGGETVVVTLTPERRRLRNSKLFQELGYSIDTIKQFADMYHYEGMWRLLGDINYNLDNLERPNFAYCALGLTNKEQEDLNTKVIKAGLAITEVIGNNAETRDFVEKQLQLRGKGDALNTIETLGPKIDIEMLEAMGMDRIRADHDLIIQAITEAGISIYDPVEAPFNPKNKIVRPPRHVWMANLIGALSSKYFSFTNIGPTSGGGQENDLINIGVGKPNAILVPREVYVSRMTTGIVRGIVLQYHDLKVQKAKLVEYWKMLKHYGDFGVGICAVEGVGADNKGHESTLVVYDKSFKGTQPKPECLTCVVEQNFPDFKFDYTLVQPR